MTRWSTVVLTGLGTYGVAMAVTGVALAVDSGDHRDDTAVIQTAQLAAAAPGVPPVPVPAGPAPSPLAGQPSAVPDPPSLIASSPLPASSKAGGSGVPSARQASAGPGQTVSFRPVEITLPNGATAPILPSDVTSDGSLVIPTNPRTVGIWTGGAQPGEQFGNVVIAGHIDSARFGLGTLAGLKGVHAGEVIKLSAGQSQMSYRVTGTLTVRQQSLATNAEYFQQDGPPRLVVITCGGPFDPVRHRYQDNYIVLANPLV